jgi:Vitamin K-dependent gamma-carboxylase
VKVRSFVELWNAFFFAEQSPVPIALFRVIFGTLVIGTLLLLRPDWLTWYGAHAWVSLSTVQTLEKGARLNLFVAIPQTNAWVEAFFWFFLASAMLLTVGFLTRLNSLIVFLCLTSIHQRNLYITHGGDTFLRVAAFFLIFAAAGAALSLDRLIRIWRGKEGAKLRPCRPWAQRMIQIELSLVYFAAFCYKAEGISWVQGTALYYVYNLDELRRFPLPSWFLHPMVLKLGSWFTLLWEFSLGVLIWVEDLRPVLLALGVLLHLFLEYSLNIPMFQWDILSAYILFVDAADLERLWNWIRVHAASHVGAPLEVIYDEASERNCRIVELLTALDIFHRLSFRKMRASGSGSHIVSPKTQEQILVSTSAGLKCGIDRVFALGKAVPLLWPLAVAAIFRRR